MTGLPGKSSGTRGDFLKAVWLMMFGSRGLPVDLCLVVGMALLVWTGTAEAVMQASAEPLRSERVMTVLIAAAAVLIVRLWREQASDQDPRR